MVIPAWAKPNQVNTPIGKELFQSETITIVDPRHPLYDQSFPLLHVKNRQDLILSCVVQITTGAERLVPVAVTNLAAAAPDVFPTLLDLSSLHNLTQTYARIAAEVKMVTEWRDETKGKPSDNQGDATDSVANARGGATAASVSGSGARLPADGGATSGAGES